MKKITTIFFALGLIQGCSHPLEIVGQGDITDLNGSEFGCTLEQYQAEDDACVKNLVIGGYDVNYKAVARPGWQFVRWDGAGCGPSSQFPDCKFVASADVVLKFWFKTLPASTAVFCENSSIGYSQNFEAMTPGQGYPPNDLADDGWKIFGAEYAVNPYTNPGAVPVGTYGTFDAADGDPGSIQAIANNEGGPAQGLQHLNKYSDYNNLNQASNFIEGITLQERFVVQADVGVWTLTFDAKRKSPDNFGIGGQSSAYAFIKTLDSSEFFQKGFATIDMTSAGEEESWARYSVTLEITPDMVGDLLQFGFSATAFNYEPSGIYYDNIFFGTCAAL